MSGRIPMPGWRAVQFDEAFEKRREYVRAAGLDRLVGGEESVPMPPCPRCASSADQYTSSTYDDEPSGTLVIEVGPCGHEFVVRPVPPRFDPDGYWSMRETP